MKSCYTGVVYFAGPKSRWSGRIAESETLARFDGRWRWVVRMATVSLFRRLDPACCGYVILENGVCLEHFDPPIE